MAGLMQLTPIEGPDLSNVYKYYALGQQLGAKEKQAQSLADIGLAYKNGGLGAAESKAFETGNPELGLKFTEGQRKQAEFELKQLQGVVDSVEQNPEQWPAIRQSLIQRGASGLSAPEYNDPAHAVAMGRNMLETAKRKLYEAQAEFYGQRGAAISQNADTRRLKAYGDILERLGDNPEGITPELWNQENQPGGLVYTAFGRAIPFEQRDRVLQLVQARRAAGVDNQDLADAGLSADQAGRAVQQQALTRVYGKPPQGKRWRADGSLEDIPGGTRQTQTDRQSLVIAKSGLQNLKDAEAFFANPGAFGGGIPGYITQGAGQISGQGESGRAFKAARMGIIDLVFALSGKQVSNREREEFLSLYQPQAYDTQTQQLWKIQRARRYFENVINMREQGASDDDIAAATRNAIQDGMKGPGNSAEPKSQGRVPPSIDGWSIRRLDKPSGMMRLGGPTAAERGEPSAAPQREYDRPDVQPFKLEGPPPSEDMKRDRVMHKRFMDIMKQAGIPESQLQDDQGIEDAMREVWQRQPNDMAATVFGYAARATGLRPPWHPDFDAQRPGTQAPEYRAINRSRRIRRIYGDENGDRNS